MTVREINNYLIGKTITKADINGYGIVLEFENGNSLVYNASDGDIQLLILNSKRINSSFLLHANRTNIPIARATYPGHLCRAVCQIFNKVKFSLSSLHR